MKINQSTTSVSLDQFSTSFINEVCRYLDEGHSTHRIARRVNQPTKVVLAIKKRFRVVTSWEVLPHTLPNGRPQSFEGESHCLTSLVEG